MSNEHRTWFGAKRIGYGIRPQTWQGWTITAVFVLAVIVVALMISN